MSVRLIYDFFVYQALLSFEKYAQYQREKGVKMKWIARLFIFVVLNVSFAHARGAIYWIYVDTPIHPISARYIDEMIEEARANRVEFLVIQLNTPGGLSSSTEKIIQTILNSNIPIIGYVAPAGAHAASAGFFILMATDVAVMAPGTRTGASTPIFTTGGGGGSDKDEKGDKNTDKEILRRKVMNDLIALLKSITKRRGRNSELAIKAITEAMAFNENEALEKKLIEFIAKDEQDLLQKLDGYKVTLWNGKKVTLRTKNIPVVRRPMSNRYRILSFLMDPSLIFILYTIGMLGIYVEISHPGLIFPGVLGLVCIILALVGTQVMPINWGALVMIALAFLLFLLEIKITSYGMLTIGGLVLLMLGGLMMVNDPFTDIGVSKELLLALVGFIGAIVIFVAYFVYRTYRNRPATGQEGMVGQRGTAKSDLEPGKEGWVFADGTLWRAFSDLHIKKGEPVTIVHVDDGMVLHVKPLKSSSPSSHDESVPESQEYHEDEPDEMGKIDQS